MSEVVSVRDIIAEVTEGRQAMEQVPPERIAHVFDEADGSYDRDALLALTAHLANVTMPANEHSYPNLTGECSAAAMVTESAAQLFAQAAEGGTGNDHALGMLQDSQAAVEKAKELTAAAAHMQALAEEAKEAAIRLQDALDDLDKARAQFVPMHEEYEGAHVRTMNNSAEFLMDIQ